MGLLTKGSAHLEHKVLEVCSLCSRPMKTSDSAGRWDQRHIDDQILDLSPKSIGSTDTGSQ